MRGASTGWAATVGNRSQRRRHPARHSRRRTRVAPARSSRRGCRRGREQTCSGKSNWRSCERCEHGSGREIEVLGVVEIVESVGAKELVRGHVRQREEGVEDEECLSRRMPQRPKWSRTLATNADGDEDEPQRDARRGGGFGLRRVKSFDGPPYAPLGECRATAR